MEDGGLVVISVPVNPFRCPPGPYERASLIAHYLKTRKPRSSSSFLMQRMFSRSNAYSRPHGKSYTPDILEWVSLSTGGKVTSVDPGTNTLVTDFEKYQANVANVIPPQRAGAIAERAGVTDASGWCPIDPVTLGRSCRLTFTSLVTRRLRAQCRNLRSQRICKLRFVPWPW